MDNKRSRRIRGIEAAGLYDSSDHGNIYLVANANIAEAFCIYLVVNRSVLLQLFAYRISCHKLMKAGVLKCVVHCVRVIVHLLGFAQV